MKGDEEDPAEVLSKDDEDEGFRQFTSSQYLLNVTEEEVKQARRNKGKHVYEIFLRPILGDETYTVQDIMEDIGPAYNIKEVEAALEYGERQDEIEYEDGNVRKI